MEQNDIIEIVFDNMINEYQTTLKSYYPAHRSKS